MAALGTLKIRATVYELEVKNGTLSCSCPLGMKHNFCKHKVSLMIKLKMITAPENVMILTLGVKTKRGRPKKMGGALSYI